MARTEATTHKPRTPFWNPRTSFVIVAILTISACVVVRLLDGLQNAGAQRGEAQPTKTSSALPESVVAVIDGKPIHRKNLANECLKRFGEEVLESLISKTILLNECKQRQVTVTREEVEQEIESMGTKFGLPKARWLELLHVERGISPAQYRADVIWPTLALRKLGAQTLRVSEQEIHQACESQYGAKVSVRLIAVTQRDKAERIHQMATQQPGKFARLAMDHSEDTNSAAYGGVVPPIRRDMGNPKLESAVFALKPGEISGIIPVANQFLILKCENHLPPVKVSDRDMKALRAKLVQRIRRQKEREVAATTFEKLQQTARPELVFYDAQLRQQMPGVAAVVVGQQITVGRLAEACIERHGTEVLEIEINRRLLQQELLHKRAKVEQNDIDREIKRAARVFGITKNDGSADVRRWLKMVTEEEGATEEIYISDVVWPTVALKKMVGNSITVTEDDLHKGFEANYGERVECLAIVLSDQRRAATVHQEANETKTDAHFGRLASVYSIEPVSRNNNGKIPPIARHSGQPHVEKQAFNMQPGEISSIIVSQDRFIILRCLGRTKPVVEDFSAVRNLLHENLREKKLRVKMATTFDLIKERAQIDNFLAKTSQPGKRREQTASGNLGPDGRGQPRSRRPVTMDRPVVSASATAAVRSTKRR